MRKQPLPGSVAPAATADLANGFANDGSGPAWIRLDQITGRRPREQANPTILDSWNLATDQKAGGSNPSVRAHVSAVQSRDRANPPLNAEPAR
jgi:hypothetical protein